MDCRLHDPASGGWRVPAYCKIGRAIWSVDSVAIAAERDAGASERGGTNAAFRLGMDYSPLMQTTEYVRVGLWIANLVIYACAIWLYLQPSTDDAPRACPLCGSSDVLCVGVRTTMSKETGRLPLLVAGGALGRRG